MGGGSYHYDVQSAREAISTTRASDRAFQYHQSAERGEVSKVHPALDIRGMIRECCDSQEHPATTPIAVVMDVTSSRGKDAKAIYAQVPSLLGTLQVSQVVPDPQIMWLACGDANTDRAPLQMGQFESDRRIDEQLGHIWMEEGGGGTGQETYELPAYALAEKTKLDCLKRGKKGFAFFLGDERPYAELSKAFVKEHIGDSLRSDISTEEVFKKLGKKFHTFLIFPRSNADERKAAIDTEIRQRLLRFNGQFKEVDIRASLIWQNRDDLDLHCQTPSGEHIYYGAKMAGCGGNLDVDKNVHGEEPKPVENIRWKKGSALAGKYKVWVELFRHHEAPNDVPFKVELDVAGEIQSFEGVAKRNQCHQRYQAFEFVYKPGKNRERSEELEAYRDELILTDWARYIGEPQILRVQDAASSVEVMIGAMALQSGKITLDQFIKNMKERKVAADRRDDVHTALKGFANQGVFTEVDATAFT